MITLGGISKYYQGGGGAVAPVFTVAPQISGTAVVNQTLTVSYTITGTPTVITRRWYRGATLISTSTSSDTYVLVAADAGQNITCNVDADGVSNATSNVLGIFATLLDLQPYGVGNYELRLLRGAYLGSPLIRVRRSSDNVEMDIYTNTSFTLDTSTLMTFAGGNSLSIVKVYNQGLAGGDMIQSTPAAQPLIVIAGVLQLEGGLPTIVFTGTTYLTAVVGWTNTFSLFNVFKINNTSTLQVPFRDNGAGNSTGVVGYTTNHIDFYRIRQTSLSISASLATEFGTTRKLLTLSSNISNIGEALINNVSRGTKALSGDVRSTIYWGVNGPALSLGMVGNSQAFNVMTNNNNSTVNGLINSYYGIY